MMKSLLAAVIVSACIVLGAIGGTAMRPGQAPHAGADDKVETGDHGAPSAHNSDPHAKKPAQAKHGGHGGDTELSGDTSHYFKFSREFVVPIMRDGRVKSLIILNINLETDARSNRELFSLEPKLRDNIMTTLVSLSNDGDTLEDITNVENYESVRALVLLNLKNVMTEGIRNVLILDVARQDL